MKLKVLAMIFVVAAAAVSCNAISEKDEVLSLVSIGKALTFCASFDGRPDAAMGAGDLKIYHAPGMDKRGEAKAGLPDGAAALAHGKGRSGDALQFLKKSPAAIFFKAGQNLRYQKENWSGTVSLWLSLDPDKDLEPGYCDPIQITPREWNDAALFVDFTKDDSPRHFRMGIFADRSVWDPQKREWDAVPVGERPMADVANPPFARGKWTHVAFTFANFNTGKEDGVARFYLDGKLAGELKERKQTFTWDPDQTVIFLGLSYIGLYDDLAIFDRALSDGEIELLYHLEGSAAALKK